MQDAAGVRNTSAQGILGMAITAPLLVPAAKAVEQNSVGTTHKAVIAPAARAARPVLRCSLSLTDGAASLSTAGRDVPKPAQLHASCHIATLQAVTNRTQQPSSTSAAQHLAPALPQPHSTDHNVGAAAAGHRAWLPVRVHSRGHRRSASKLRTPPSVAAVAGAGRHRLGFLTDPGELDACLQLGVVEPTAGCQLPVALDATPVPRCGKHPGSERCAASRRSSFAVLDEQGTGPAPERRAAASPPNSAARTAAVTLHSPDCDAATALLQGLRTKMVDSASRTMHAAAAELPAATVPPVRASSSIYRVAWEAAAASTPPASASARPSTMQKPSLHIALRTDSSSVLLQGRRHVGAQLTMTTQWDRLLLTGAYRSGAQRPEACSENCKMSTLRVVFCRFRPVFGRA